MPDHAPTLGALPTPTSGRDAVHVAIFPAYADVSLSPGDHLEIVGDRAGSAFKVKWVPSGGDAVVDCFLADPLPPGQLFYAMLRPGTISGLRHVWTSPKFTTMVPT